MDDNPPEWMTENESDFHEQDEAPLDENSLASILHRAVAEISELGGRERHRLSQVLGRQNYDRLLAKPKVAQAVENWEGASNKTKAAATRLLAVHIARAAETPELVDRIQREIADAFDDDLNMGKSGEAPVKAPTGPQIQKHRAAIDQRRNGQRVSYSAPKNVDLHMLAKSEDGRRYIEARRRQQKERRA